MGFNQRLESGSNRLLKGSALIGAAALSADWTCDQGSLKRQLPELQDLQVPVQCIFWLLETKTNTSTACRVLLAIAQIW